MQRITMVILCLLIGLAAPCQSKKERKKNKVRSTTEWETIIRDGKSLDTRVAYEEFDKEGRSTLKIEYDPDGNIKFKSTVAYNSNGDKSEETESEPAKKKDLRLVYRYNAMKDKTEEVEYDGGSIRKKKMFTYDASGNKLTETETDASGTMVKKSVYTYNSKNLKTGKRSAAGVKHAENPKKWEYVFYK